MQQDSWWGSGFERGLYIGDYLYAVAEDRIVSVNLDTMRVAQEFVFFDFEEYYNNLWGEGWNDPWFCDECGDEYCYGWCVVECWICGTIGCDGWDCREECDENCDWWCCNDDYWDSEADPPVAVPLPAVVAHEGS
jgi:hypothetical protein